MKLRMPLFCMLISSLLNALLAGAPYCKTTPEGIIIFTHPFVTGASMAIKLEVIADNIIRVMAAPGKKCRPEKA